ncbi:hypothetical protein EV126DRAFT_517545 [Verticillium dahliae]|nr:hypothetical protein EV126DRAFT_517545 [Verticillium dahliae]
MAAVATNGFAARLGAFQATDDQRMQWPRSMHQELCDITDKYQNLCGDLAREKIAGRGLQTDSKRREESFRFTKLDESFSAFVLVLLDTDTDAYMASSLGVRKTARMESTFRTGFLSGLVSALLSLTATAVSRSPRASSSVVSSEGHAAHLAATWARAAASSPTDEGSALHGGGTGHTPPSGVTARAGSST